MAKIKFGAMMVDARGKLGGHVFSKNRGGAYLRTKVTPVNPRATAQTAIRQVFSSVSKAWGDLTAPQRQTWNDGVSEWATTDIFGDLKNPSGKALYQKINTTLLSIARLGHDTLPAKMPIESVNVASVTLEQGFNTVDIQPNPTGTTTSICVYSSGVVSPGTTFVRNKMRRIYFSVNSVFDPAVCYYELTQKFGPIPSGSKIFFGITFVNDSGQQTPMQIVETVAL